MLTLRAAAVLARADVVVHDALVTPEILRTIPSGAEVIDAGKRPRQHTLSQEELNQLLVSKAREGKTVVRLKGGDPYVFGRGGEEAEQLFSARIPFEVVPGITSAVAVPALAGIPITHRDCASTFQVITGHEDPGKESSLVDWAATAAVPGTKVILMCVERIRAIASELVSHGMPGSTPIAMVRWGTTGRQETIDGTLANIADIAEERKFSAPAVAVIGDVVRLRGKLNWFEQRPLFGQRVVVTRTREQASDLARRLGELGADVLEIPTIRIAPPTERQAIVEAITGIGEYDWLVFTSPNGVAKFFEYFHAAYQDIRDIGGIRIAAVGPATAAKLREQHLKVDVMPEDFVASKIAKAINAYETVENLRFLLVRAEVATPELPRQLEDMGGIVDDIPFYQTTRETEDPLGVAARLQEEGADWITFTSSSTVEHFHARFDLPALLKRFPGIRLASIGPETSKAIAGLQLAPHAEAHPHNLDGLVHAIEKAVKVSRQPAGA